MASFIETSPRLKKSFGGGGFGPFPKQNRLGLTSGEGAGPAAARKALKKLGRQDGFQILVWTGAGAPPLKIPGLRTKVFRRAAEALSGPFCEGHLLEIKTGAPAGGWVEEAGRLCLSGDLSAMITGPARKSSLWLPEEAALQASSQAAPAAPQAPSQAAPAAPQAPSQAAPAAPQAPPQAAPAAPQAPPAAKSQARRLPAPGQTHILKSLCRAEDVFMAFLGRFFHVLLFTDHIPLKNISLDPKKLRRFLDLALEARRLLPPARRQKPVGLLGLNPHAGEGGLTGGEERDILLPLLKSFPKGQIEGPLSPDSAFLKKNWGRYSFYAALYHDQGLIPFKAAHFPDGAAINIGLPFLRLGAAYGTGSGLKDSEVSEASMLMALREAARLIREFQG